MSPLYKFATDKLHGLPDLPELIWELDLFCPILELCSFLYGVNPTLRNPPFQADYALPIRSGHIPNYSL